MCQMIYFFCKFEILKKKKSEIIKQNKKGKKTCTKINWPQGDESYILSMLSMREITWVIRKWSLTLWEIPVHEK